MAKSLKELFKEQDEEFERLSPGDKL